jgi:hypothetical protein
MPGADLVPPKPDFVLREPQYSSTPKNKQSNAARIPHAKSPDDKSEICARRLAAMVASFDELLDFPT